VGLKNSRKIELRGGEVGFGGGGGGGTFASAEGKSHVGGSGDILPQKIFKFGGSETLFSALVMRYVSVKRQVFSVLTTLFPSSC